MGYLVAPGVPEFGESVQQYDEWPASLCDVVHANAVGDDIAVLPCFCCCLHHVFLKLGNLPGRRPINVKIRSAVSGGRCALPEHPSFLLFLRAAAGGAQGRRRTGETPVTPQRDWPSL